MAQTDYTGVASSAKLVGTLAASSGAGTVVSVDNATGWPTGATGIPFVGCFDRGSSTEEKILFSSRSGNDLTVAQRGYDDTSAITHQNNAPVEHTVDATVLRTSSAHVFDTTRDDHTQYAKTSGTRTFTGGVTVAAATSKFGSGAAGAAQGFVSIGDDTGGNGFILAGHGTVANAQLVLRSKGTSVLALQGGAGNTVVQVSSVGLGFYGGAPQAKGTMSGSRASGAALQSIINQLNNIGLFTDSTSA